MRNRLLQTSSPDPPIHHHSSRHPHPIALKEVDFLFLVVLRVDKDSTYKRKEVYDL